MKRLIRKNDCAIWYTADVVYIKEILNKYGYDAADTDIAWAWQEHSVDYGASWLIVDGYSEGRIVYTILQYLREEPDLEEYFKWRNSRKG